jgi:hypothetical protein
MSLRSGWKPDASPKPGRSPSRASFSTKTPGVYSSWTGEKRWLNHRCP